MAMIRSTPRIIRYRRGGREAGVLSRRRSDRCRRRAPPRTHRGRCG
jgi:hypothetical protein